MLKFLYLQNHHTIYRYIYNIVSVYGVDVHTILVCLVLISYVQDKEHIVSKLGGELLKSSFDKVGLQNPCNFCTARPFSSVYCHH